MLILLASLTPYIITLTVIFLCLISGMAWGLSKLYRFIFKSAFLGNTITVRLLNIALTSIIFKWTFYYLLIKPLFLFCDLITEFINAIQELTAGTEVNMLLLLSCVKKLFEPVRSLIANDILNSNLFFALALAGIITLTVNKIFYSKEQQMYVPGLKALYPIQQNFFLFVIMVFSFFLVLSAMVAIPYNGSGDGKDGKNTATDSLVLPIRYLDSLKKSDYTIDTAFLFRPVSNTPLPVNDKGKELLAQNLNTVKNYFDNQNKKTEEYIDRYNAAGKDFKKYQAEAGQSIKNIYLKSDLKRKLRAAFSQDLSDFFNRNTDQNINMFSDFKGFISNNFARLKDNSISIINAYPAFVEQLNKLDTLNHADTYLNSYFDLYLTNPLYDIDRFDFSHNLDQIPKEPSLGTDWGPLGRASGWLTSTQSTDLALIVGMFGFGLLGAAISSFITSRKEELNDPETPLLNHLPVVIIRGFSAAIVIFLATKGGIAVMNSGTNEPNPYVLFFTCLVGAVFSEPIWEWAKIQIVSRFPSEDKRAEADKKLAEAAAAQKPATENKAAGNEPVTTDPNAGETPKKTHGMI